MRAPIRTLGCRCATCAPPASRLFDRLTIWFAVAGFLLMPGRALFQLGWEALSR
ncbi:hypothetical protein OMP43_03760 [Sphingomonas sp. CBMAI 2297]|uniref:hypothetical protein n=1 Tax=Sphingomonas sp. CBMAI 2297 TaxID=2991720 RepID=UPI002456670F|nr:hypothetical protein [Sphingomonas sp. CBMAI 2297]MDH4743131.1 hypothetical protein [Sphingomonas sp. CBMAI 2297]